MIRRPARSTLFPCTTLFRSHLRKRWPVSSGRRGLADGAHRQPHRRRHRRMKLLEVCEQLVKHARKAGAAEAEAYAERTRDSSARVRDGEGEELPQASSKGVGLRVIGGGRLGFAYGTEFSQAGFP